MSLRNLDQTGKKKGANNLFTNGKRLWRIEGVIKVQISLKLFFLSFSTNYGKQKNLATNLKMITEFFHTMLTYKASENYSRI